ncbi:hypothetical protein J5226_07255 [Lysobacter sp. K5869]|uniref:hypothetical protein n=1 Tax=Lysobacter sp. K5869 TaxID=2820808 RepID=UPI001C06154A|nr:hypothetical protein [Lysobacter sp. K5869]QWP78186.1 hypothetical protein J5226_07255 [Lysobacter sp. K5869]
MIVTEFRSANARPKRWSYFLAIACAAGLCAVVMSVLRAGYYVWMDLRPEMGPGMFIIFSPLFAAAFAVLAVLCEGVLAWAAPSLPARKPLWIGASYAFVLAGLIRPELLVLVLVLNPATLHLFFAMREKRRSATER